MKDYTEYVNTHFKIFSGQEGEARRVKREATAYAARLKKLGFHAVVVKRHFANPNYDVVYYTGKLVPLIPKEKRRFEALEREQTRCPKQRVMV